MTSGIAPESDSVGFGSVTYDWGGIKAVGTCHARSARIAGSGNDDAFGGTTHVAIARIHRLGGGQLRLSGGKERPAVAKAFETAAARRQADRDKGHCKECKTLFHGGRLLI